ncbi:MAG: hypothetical protein K2J32_10135 [Ruminococcus sp.]|nr:hypothetical protein [Ruminococcus sp.]
MKKMKILMSVLALALATLTPMASFAIDDDTQAETNTPTIETTTESGKSQSDTLELSQVHAANYKIQIPSGRGELKERQAFEVSATGLLEYGKKLTVSVESENDWHLVDEKHPDNKIKYTMRKNFEDITEQEIDILTLSAEDKGGTVTLTVAEIGNAKYAGEYKDTLTFKVKTDSQIEGEITKELYTDEEENETPITPPSSDDDEGNKDNESNQGNQTEKSNT